MTQRLRLVGMQSINSSQAMTMMTSSPSKLNSGSSSDWLQHSLPMLAGRQGGGAEFLVR
uniref:Uncharacterized protein n=1 Tax=Arundo donax TaxID=35708 RepID=A0A0A9FBQ6_ARUDO